MLQLILQQCPPMVCQFYNQIIIKPFILLSPSHTLLQQLWALLRSKWLSMDCITVLRTLTANNKHWYLVTRKCIQQSIIDYWELLYRSHHDQCFPNMQIIAVTEYDFLRMVREWVWDGSTDCKSFPFLDDARRDRDEKIFGQSRHIVRQNMSIHIEIFYSLFFIYLLLIIGSRITMLCIIVWEQDILLKSNEEIKKKLSIFCIKKCIKKPLYLLFLYCLLTIQTFELCLDIKEGWILNSKSHEHAKYLNR